MGFPNRATSLNSFVQPKIRIREGLRRALKAEADKNLRPLNAEIALRLMQSLGMSPTPKDVRPRKQREFNKST